MRGGELEDELWLRVRRDDDEQAFEFLFVEYAPLARQIATRLFSRVSRFEVEWADCVQNATVGLLEAMRRYDPDVGVSFEAFALPRVRGAVFNGLREVRQHPLVQRARERQTERMATLSEQSSGDDLSDLVDAIVALGIGYLIETASEHCPGEAGVAGQQTGQLVSEALAHLNDQELAVVTAHYFNHLTFAAVAEHLGLSRGRISQIHRSALGKLRHALGAMRELGYEY